MKSKKLINLKASVKVALACAAIGSMCWCAANVCVAQTPPSNLSPGLQEVVRLSQAQMSDDVIVTYIKNSGKSFQLSADDMLYLKNQGVSQGVIAALLQTSTAVPALNPNPVPAPVAPPQPAPVVGAQPPPPPPPPVEAPAPLPAPEINFNYFHDQLAPFGTWVNVGGVLYWHPDQAIAANPDWRPYYDMGQWVQTDNGLFWQSDYTWGDIPFHYGRWVLVPPWGWLWAPDYTWGPAWVFWRHAEGDAAIGWAPLPVGAVFVDGVFMFNGIRVGLDFDFGLGETCFVFMGYDHFHEGFFRMRGHEYAWHIYGNTFHDFYRRSVIRNDFRKDEHGRFINYGIGRDRLDHIALVTHHPMEKVSFEERHPVGDRKALELARNTVAGKQFTRTAVQEHDQFSKAGDQFTKTGVQGHDQFTKTAVQEHDQFSTTGGQGHDQFTKTGVQGHDQFTRTGGQTASVSKVFRPPAPAPKLPMTQSSTGQKNPTKK
jgi:hypothetical protein